MTSTMTALGMTVLLSMYCQAADPGVAVYGQVNVGLVWLHESGVSQRRVDNFYAPSLIGIKGSESLAPGTQAFFLVETKINPDTAAATNFADREGWVGLTGHFGKVALGRGYTPYTNMANQFDLLFGAIGLAINAVDRAGDAGLGGGTARLGNSLRYDSPMANGIDASAMYGVGENASSTAAATNTFSAFVRSRQSGWQSFAAIHRTQHVAGIAQREGNLCMIGAGRQFGAVTAQLAWQHAALQQYNGTTDRIRTSWVATLRYPFSPTDALVLGGLYLNPAKDNGSAVQDSGAWRLGVGWKHSLAKRTHTVVEYIQQLNQDGTSRRAASAGLLIAF